ncbi:MAG: hypothetical protein AAGL29_03530 [Bacteroidota bacterium]
MKLKQIVWLMVCLTGMVGTLVLSSFTSVSACQYANSNLQYIKAQTKEALATADFEKSRYHTFKAINGIEKTRDNFKACGCEKAIEGLEQMMVSLKSASKSKSKSSVNYNLEEALMHSKWVFEELALHESESYTDYGDDLLVLNTKDVLDAQGGVLLPESKLLEKRIHDGLKAYEKSTKKVVETVDCKEARAFLQKTYEHTQQQLLNPDLTRPKKIYHQRVLTITESALGELGSCQ